MNLSLRPGVSATGNLASKLGRVKRNLASDTNDGHANLWHYLDQSAANSGPTLTPTADIGNGSTNCRGVLAAASASGKPLKIPPGVYKVDSNVTIATRIVFAPGAILKPASGVVVTLTGGYAAEDTQQVFDISLGGSFVISNRSSLSVMHFGALPDYVGPNAGTDNAAAIQACFDASQALAVSLGQRILVTIPPGAYRILSFLSVPFRVDLDMTGATLHYRSTDRTDAVLTIGADGLPSGGKYTKLNVTGWSTTVQPTEAERETFACVKVVSANNCTFELGGLTTAAIGLLLAAGKSKDVSHNRFHDLNCDTCKVAVELRGNFSVGYVNENDFFGFNLSLSSSAFSLGGLYGVKFSTARRQFTLDHTTDTFTSAGHGLSNGDYGYVYSDASYLSVPTGMNTTNTYFVINATTDTFQLSATLGGASINATSNGSGNLFFHGYSGQNSNRFYGTCFQVTGHTTTYELTVSKVVTTGIRYVNMSNEKEYYCSAGGTVATVPTHTTGSVTDANGVAFTYVGAYRRCPVWFDRAGSYNIFYGCRWESGYGGFARINQPPTLSFKVTGNEMHVYGMDSNAKNYPVLDYFSDATTNALQHENKIKLYGQEDASSCTLKAIHHRAIGSGTNLCVKGMYFKTPGSTAFSQYATGTYVLCKDSLYSAVGKYMAVSVDIGSYHAIRFAHDNAGVNIGRIWVYLADSKFVHQAISDYSILTYGLCSIETVHATYYGWYTGADTVFSGSVRRNPTSTIKYAVVSYSNNGIEISNVYIQPSLAGLQGSGGLAEVRLCTPYEPDSNLGGRFAYGTPTVGYFLATGEYIANINTATSQPLGWVVKTPGVLCPSWVTATAVRKGELRMSDTNKIYAALAAGTTGATAPTGTADVSDGTVTWEYVTTQAVLTATTQVH